MRKTHIMTDASHSKQTVASADEDEIDLMELVRALWRGKGTIILFALIAVICGGYYLSQIATARYQSSVDITINLRNTEVVDLQSVVSGVSTDYSSLRTELEIIRSRGILEQVVDELDLSNDPDFNPALREPSDFDRYINEFKTRTKDFVTGIIYSLIPAGSPNKTDNLDSPEPSEAAASDTASQQTRDRMIGMLRGSVSASVKGDTYVFVISVTTGSPEMSQEIANTLADVYIQDQIAVKFEATEQAVTWLSERVTNLEQELKAKEDTLKEALSETDMINPETLEGLNLQAKDLRDRLQETQNQIDQTETRISRLRGLRDAESFDEIVEVTEDRTLGRLLDAVQNDDQDALQMFDQRLETILQTAESDLERLRNQARALQNSSEQLEQRIDRQSTDLVRIQQMQREVEATRTLYETFLTRLKETSVQRGLQQADSRVLSRAMPGGQVAPRSSLVLALSLVLGGTVGGGLVLIRNFMHNVFRTSEDLEAATGILVMGQVPKMPIKARKELVTYLSDKPMSASAEAIRNLRTSILLSNIDTPPQVIMTTSSVPGEGKTTASIALAMNFSGLGKRVLLMEGDMRRRSFSNYFDAPHNTGLITALSGDKPVDEIIISYPDIGTDVLMAERSRANAADLFSSERFRKFLEEMREIYDVIIIDTPPVLVVPDARVIGQHADSTIFLVAWDSTHRGQVKAALANLASVNLNVSGLVLSQIDPKGMRKYGYGEKYGTYANYGKSYYEAG